MHLTVPKDAEFVLHLVIEELLLSSLSAEDLLHVQSTLSYYLVKHSYLFLVDLFLEVLNLLDAFDFSLLLLIMILLPDIFFELLRISHESFVTLDHSLLFHVQLLLDLLHFLKLPRRFYLQCNFGRLLGCAASAEGGKSTVFEGRLLQGVD